MIKYIKVVFDIDNIISCLQRKWYRAGYSDNIGKVYNNNNIYMYNSLTSETWRVVVIKDSKSDRVLILEEDINIYAYLTELGIAPKLTMDDVQYYNS